MSASPAPSPSPQGRPGAPGATAALPAAGRREGPAPLWVRAPVLGGVGLVLALPLVLALISGAWNQDRAAVAAVAQEFLDALHGGNGEALQPLLSARVGPIATITLPGTAHLRLQLVRGRVDSVVVQGNSAVAYYTLLREDGPVTINLPAPLDDKTLRSQAEAIRTTADRLAGQRGTLLLRREDGRWRVRGVAFPVKEGGEGPTFTWETDDPARLSPEQAEAFRAFEELVAVDPRQWDTSWQVDLDLKDVPARDALQDLARGLGLPLVNPPQPFPALDRPVSLRLRGRSRLEAVEEVCRQAGVQARCDAAGLHVTAGRRAEPVAPAGPFLVEAVEVKEFPPHPTGALKLRCVTGRLPAPVAGLWRTEARPWRIDTVAAADGRDLYHAANQRFYGQSSLARGRESTTLSERAWVVPLRNLLRDLDAVHQVRGRLPVALPVRVDVIRFDRLAPGVAGQAGDVRLTVRQVDQVDPGVRAGGPPPAGTAARPALEFDAGGIDGRRLKFAAYEALGRKLACGEPSTPRPDLVRVEVPGEPAAVVFKVVSLQEVEYAFELRDVPLRQRPPQRLEPARFPGHEAPVSVEFLGVVPARDRQGPFLPGPPKFPAVKLRLDNHCQKGVEQVRMKLTYLDAAGRPLKEAARTAATFNEQEGRLRVLEPGKPFEVEEPDLPGGTVKAAVTVTAVGFADGTGWPP